jgi:ubiquinone/menaquinone biosynthesis C-methylase UbiE
VNGLLVTLTSPRTATVVGNVYDKYRTRNPVARLLMSRFLGATSGLYALVEPDSVLEVGAGEGLLADHLLRTGHRPGRFVATDISTRSVGRNLDPLIEFREASIYELPFEDRSFDLVVCCEVLEHLEAPARGLAEVARAAKHAVLLSTPWEPVWRALNLARGAYWSSLGNTPGHVQHFSRRGLLRLVDPHIVVSHVRRPLPWTVLLGRPRR